MLELWLVAWLRWPPGRGTLAACLRSLAEAPVATHQAGTTAWLLGCASRLGDMDSTAASLNV